MANIHKPSDPPHTYSALNFQIIYGKYAFFSILHLTVDPWVYECAIALQHQECPLLYLSFKF